MADVTLQALVRQAERSADPLDLGRASRGLAKVGRFDEASWLQVRHGRPDSEVLDGFALRSVADLRPVPLCEPGALKRLSHVAWAPDGRSLLAAVDKAAVVAWDEETLARRDIAPLEASVKAMASDATGRRLLLCVSDGRAARRGEDDLQVVDLERGVAGPRLRVGLGLVFAVTLPADDPDLLVVAGRSTLERRVGHWVAGFRLRKGKLPARKPAWRETAPLIALHAGGFVTVKRGKLGRHTYAAPGAPETVATECRNTDADRLAAACARAVVVGQRLWLVSAQGAQLAASTVTRATHHAREDAWLDVLAAPTGRQVAVTHKKTDVLTLVDVASGFAVRHELGARPRRPEWSPSGRKLAVPLEDGSVVVLRTDDDGAPSPARDAPWLELARPGPDGGTWAVRRVGRTVEVRGAERRAPGAFQRRRILADEATAKGALTRAVREKEAEGYRPIARKERS